MQWSGDHVQFTFRAPDVGDDFVPVGIVLCPFPVDRSFELGRHDSRRNSGGDPGVIAGLVGTRLSRMVQVHTYTSIPHTTRGTVVLWLAGWRGGCCMFYSYLGIIEK